MSGMESLVAVAERLSARGKGILASDESNGTIGKRFEKSGLENNEETRRAYREIFYTADIGNAISGAIMYKETLFQSARDGRPFVKCLTDQGVLPGIKVDEGLSVLDGTDIETYTKGLETLADRCLEYTNQGARFAKWRAALKVGNDLPSDAAVEKNAKQLAEYAAICQAKGLVPIVEPEVLIDGAHTIKKFAEVNERAISDCIAQLHKSSVLLEACLIKPQMMINGADFPGGKATKEEVASHTLRVMKRCVPPAIPGIHFLSGGQTEEEATINLNEINAMATSEGRSPWSLSFSFGRGLQASVLKVWSEDQNAVEAARKVASELARVNGEACTASYKGPHPSLLSNSGTLRETFRGWSGSAGATGQ